MAEKPNMFLDTIYAPIRGLEGFAQSTYNLADYLTGDILPDYDKRITGRSETLPGQLVEGTTQFLAGFIPLVGVAGKAGKLAQAGKLLGTPTRRALAAGVGADFIAFSEQEDRLSNLIQQYPQLQNPITEFLAADEDDAVVTGRLKNVIEGLALGGIADGLFRGIKAVKAGKKAKVETGDPVAVQDAVAKEIGDEPLETSVEVKEPEDLIDTGEGVTIKTAEPEDAAPKTDIEDTETKAKPEEPEAKVESEEPEVKGEEFEISDEGLLNRTEDNVDDALKEMMVELRKGLSEDKANLVIGKVVRQLKSDDVKDGYNFLAAVTSSIKKHVDSVSGTSDVLDEAQLLSVMEIMPSSVRKRMYGESALRKDIINTEEAAIRTMAYKHVMEGIKNNLVESVKEFRRVNSSQNRAAVARDLESLASFQSLYSALGAMFSKGLRRRKVFLSPEAVAKRKKKTNILDEIANAPKDEQGAIADDYLRTKKNKAINEAIKIIEEGGSTNEVLRKLGLLAESTNGGKFDMFREYYINNILSGLPTQAANILGNLLTTGLLTFERTAGHLITGDIAKAKLALASALDLESVWAVSAKWAGRAAKEDEAFLIPGHRAFQEGDSFNAITPEKLGDQFSALQSEEGSGLYKVLDFVGNAIRLPSRGLTSMDELFKQVNARREAMYRFGVEAMDKHKITDPAKISEYINDNMTRLVTESGELHGPKAIIAEATRQADEKGLNVPGKEHEKAEFVQKYFKANYDKDTGKVAKFAAETAKEATFTKDLGGFGQKLSALTQEVPALSLVMPFIRTPLNIMKFALKRAAPELNVTKYPALLDSQRRTELELFSKDPTVAADARGRIVTTAAATGVVFSAFFTHSDRISGGGPIDPKRKKALEDQGWRPYSIRIGDKWVSYQRLDPFATIIGILADVKETLVASNYSINDSRLDMLTSATISVLSRNITNKSYLSGVEMLIDAMGDTSGNQARRLVGNIAAGTIPFSGFLKHGQNVVGDREAKEIRSIADRVLNVIPGASRSLDVKRNLLGEEKVIEGVPIIQAASPIGYSTAKNDKVFDEIASLNHAFRQVDPMYQGLIDLLQYQNASGQTAHDRRLQLIGQVKIGGRNVRQALDKLISSKAYQRLDPRSEPGLRSPRVTEINKVLNKYRSKALGQTLREFPELARYHKDFTRAKRDQKRGQAMNELLQTLNF